MGTEIEHDLLILMMVVARLTRVEADRRARQHGMTRAQWGILKQLWYNPGLSQKELADLLEVEPITVARLVDRLEKANWLNAARMRRTGASGACICAPPPRPIWMRLTTSAKRSPPSSPPACRMRTGRL